MLKIKRQHVSPFNRFRRRQPRTNRLAAAGKPREVMKIDPANQDDMRKLLQCGTDFHTHSIRGRSRRIEFRFVVSIVVQRSDTLGDERRQQLASLFFGYAPVNSSREDYGDVAGRYASLDQ